MAPSPSFGPPLLSESPSPPLPWGIPASGFLVVAAAGAFGAVVGVGVVAAAGALGVAAGVGVVAAAGGFAGAVGAVAGLGVAGALAGAAAGVVTALAGATGVVWALAAAEPAELPLVEPQPATTRATPTAPILNSARGRRRLRLALMLLGSRTRRSPTRRRLLALRGLAGARAVPGSFVGANSPPSAGTTRMRVIWRIMGVVPSVLQPRMSVGARRSSCGLWHLADAAFKVKGRASGENVPDLRRFVVGSGARSASPARGGLSSSSHDRGNGSDRSKQKRYWHPHRISPCRCVVDDGPAGHAASGRRTCLLAGSTGTRRMSG
jgi:hypothetical protein